MKKKKYKGVAFLTIAGSSGDFLSNFLSLCANKNYIFYNDNMNIRVAPNNTITSFVHPFYNKIQQTLGWNTWNNINLSDLNKSFFNNFTGDFKSGIHMHIPSWDMEWINNNNYIKFFYILKLLNEYNIKIYYIHFYSNYVASYIYCVRALSKYDIAVYNKFLKSQKNKKYYNLEIDTILLHQELIIKALIENNIDYEAINLDNLLLNRDFDGLYDQIKNSYDLEQKLPDKYKQIVNKMWDDRIKSFKEINML
jgi:hypothetical protein